MLLKPRRPVLDLDLPLAGGGRFSLQAQRPAAFTLLVFYRGFHCPICKGYLGDLNAKSSAFQALGVEPVAVSADPEERAELARREWDLTALPLAYAMPIALGRGWGLSVSHAISAAEPSQFLEPGLFLVRPDRTLYGAAVQTMPFTRPSLDELLAAMQFVVKRDYPARGEG